MVMIWLRNSDDSMMLVTSLNYSTYALFLFAVFEIQ